MIVRRWDRNMIRPVTLPFFSRPAQIASMFCFKNLGIAENVLVIDLEEGNLTTFTEAEQAQESGETIDDRHQLGVPSLEDIVERELTSSTFEEIKDTYRDQILAESCRWKVTGKV